MKHKQCFLIYQNLLRKTQFFQAQYPNRLLQSLPHHLPSSVKAKFRLPSQEDTVLSTSMSHFQEPLHSPYLICSLLISIAFYETIFSTILLKQSLRIHLNFINLYMKESSNNQCSIFADLIKNHF